MFTIIEMAIVINTAVPHLTTDAMAIVAPAMHGISTFIRSTAEGAPTTG